MLAIARLLVQRLDDGASVAVHCRRGIGRSSTLAAAVLVLEGTAPANAWDRISAARGLPVARHQRTTRVRLLADPELGP